MSKKSPIKENAPTLSVDNVNGMGATRFPTETTTGSGDLASTLPLDDDYDEIAMEKFGKKYDELEPDQQEWVKNKAKQSMSGVMTRESNMMKFAEFKKNWDTVNEASPDPRTFAIKELQKGGVHNAQELIDDYIRGGGQLFRKQNKHIKKKIEDVVLKYGLAGTRDIMRDRKIGDYDPKRWTPGSYGRAQRANRFGIDESEAGDYQLGDMWSHDFDYEGMLKMILTVDPQWTREDLEKLAASARDNNNYHSCTRPLQQAADLMQSDPKSSKIKRLLNDAKKAAKDYLKELGINESAWSTIATRNYQNRSGNFLTGKPVSISIYDESGIAMFTFKKTPLDTAKGWVERYLRQNNLKYKNIEAKKFGGIDDWTEVNVYM